MKRILVSVQDRKSEQFGPVLGYMNDADAIRAFIDAVNTPREDSMVYLHPDDFDIFRIGTMDSDTGILIPEPHRRLLTGNEAKHVIEKPKLAKAN